MTEAGSGPLWPGQAASVTYRASGALPRAGNPAHSLTRKSKGTTIPREVWLAEFQLSCLPREAVSPCFGPIFRVGFPETPNGSCDRRHGSGTSYISKIPIPIFRCLLPCAYPSQNISFYYEQYSPFQWRIVSRFMNHPYSENVFLLDYGLGLFEGSRWEMYSVWNANRLEETQTFC